MWCARRGTGLAMASPRKTAAPVLVAPGAAKQAHNAGGGVFSAVSILPQLEDSPQVPLALTMLKKRYFDAWGRGQFRRAAMLASEYRARHRHWRRQRQADEIAQAIQEGQR